MQTQTTPELTSLSLSQKPDAKIKLTGKVKSRSRDTEHTVVRYADNKLGIFGWACTCENYLFSGLARQENCAHIEVVRDNLLTLTNRLYDLV